MKKTGRSPKAPSRRRSAKLDLVDAGAVTNIQSVSAVIWEVHFADGQVLVCAKKPPRDEAHVDALITSYENSGDDPDHAARMRAMIAAVREFEAP